METILRSDEIYLNACSYHFVGFRCLSRGWCMSEFASVNKSISPVFHYEFESDRMKELQSSFVDTQTSRQQSIMIKALAYTDSEFFNEDDRATVETIIRKKFRDLADFNKHTLMLLNGTKAWKDISMKFLNVSLDLEVERHFQNLIVDSRQWLLDVQTSYVLNIQLMYHICRRSSYG